MQSPITVDLQTLKELIKETVREVIREEWSLSWQATLPEVSDTELTGSNPS